MNTFIAFIPLILIGLFSGYHICKGIIKKIGKPEFIALVTVIGFITCWMTYWLW